MGLSFENKISNNTVCTLYCRMDPVPPNPDVPLPLGDVDPKYFGSTGLSLIPDGLRYLDSTRVWIIPFFHAFYYGVLKRLCDLIFPGPGGLGHKEYLVQPMGRIEDLMLNFPDEYKTYLDSKKLIEERFGNLVSLAF